MTTPAVTDKPCGCRHNNWAETPDSRICPKHFNEDKLHFCWEWDGLLINKNSPEFESCICTDEDGLVQDSTEEQSA